MPYPSKRSDERLGHRSQAEMATEKIEIDAPTKIPEPDPDWCHIARYAWDAYVNSPLNVYFTESDLAFGWMTCHAIHEAYKTGAAMKLVAAESMMRNALFNESDRRRVKIELSHKEPETNPTVDKNVAEFRARRRRAE